MKPRELIKMYAVLAQVNARIRHGGGLGLTVASTSPCALKRALALDDHLQS
jgi:hypothetical protein